MKFTLTFYLYNKRLIFLKKKKPKKVINMQKLDFNKDGKLVAYTDNGCTDGKSATTEVKGTFEVSADVVNFILAKEYDLPATLHIKHIGYEWRDFYCLIGNKAQQELLEVYKHRVDELSNAEVELKSLRKAIDDFNKNARFYERKLKI